MKVLLSVLQSFLKFVLVLVLAILFIACIGVSIANTFYGIVNNPAYTNAAWHINQNCNPINSLTTETGQFHFVQRNYVINFIDQLLLLVF